MISTAGDGQIRQGLPRSDGGESHQYQSWWTARAVSMVEATGASQSDAENALKQTDYEVKPAILMILTGVDAQTAQVRLADSHGYLHAP